MINIAICDKDLITTSKIEEFLIVIEKEQKIVINCDIYYTGQLLIESMRQGSYFDLIFLDIDMQLESSKKIAKTISNMNVPTLIVYLSRFEIQLPELFNLKPFRFLPKPIDTSDFFTVFMSAFKKIQQKAYYFNYTFNRSYVKIPVSKIYYFESQNRLIHIYTRQIKNIIPVESNYKFYSKMSEVENLLIAKNSRFLRIHQSYLVNFDYIETMNFTNVRLENGKILQISEDRQKFVRSQFCTMRKV